MCNLMRRMIPALALLAAFTAGTQENPEVPVSETAAAVTPELYTLDKVLDALNAPIQKTFTGVLTDITAGDLVSVNNNNTPVQLRLYGVDCPETGQDFAQEARTQTVSRVLDTTVSVHILTEDSLEIPVALVFDGTGNSLSHWLAAEGLAWWDDRNAKKDSLLRKLNAQAIVAQKGIFADSAPLAPWDYRKSKELPDFEYALEALKPAPPVVPPAEEPRSLTAKGSMTENRPRSAAPLPPPAKEAPAGGAAISIPGLPADVGKDVNVGDLMMKHQPRIATDASGRPLGLTANNVGSIPYASQYGFKEGDIISRVNGISIESEAQIIGLIPQFKNVKNFQVEVLRNGQTITIPINVK